MHYSNTLLATLSLFSLAFANVINRDDMGVTIGGSSSGSSSGGGGGGDDSIFNDPKFSSGPSCPNGESNYVTNGVKYCCPGVVGGDDDNSYCCVGGKVEFKACFPSCDSEEDNNASAASCQATVYFTQSDYSQAVSGGGGAAAGTMAQTAGTMTTTTAGTMTTAAAGGEGAAEAGAAEAGNPSSSSRPSQSSSSLSSSSSKAGAAKAMVTSGPLAGAVMIAGGLLLAV